MPVIVANQEAEIRRILVQSQSRQIVHETLSWKKAITEKGPWAYTEFKPSTTKKKKKGELWELGA
jgi:hypothetical protein